ncbi:unnamed protein product, partial [Iphiclides podalirius]
MRDAIRYRGRRVVAASAVLWAAKAAESLALPAHHFRRCYANEDASGTSMPCLCLAPTDSRVESKRADVNARRLSIVISIGQHSSRVGSI